MLDDPVLGLLAPLSDFLDLLEFIHWYEVFNYHSLQLQLVCELVDGIIHVIPLPIEVVLGSLKQTMGFVVLIHELFKLSWFELKLFLDVIELVLGVEEFVLLLL